MTPLEIEIEHIKNSILDSIMLATSQLNKAKQAIFAMDVEIAEEILINENRLNALELSIDRDCENILARFNPVAIDLRFLMAGLKINSDVERIGDYAASCANYVLELKKPFNQELLDNMKLEKMFERALKMMNFIYDSFAKEDTKIARSVFKKDDKLNKISKSASSIIDKYVKDYPDQVRHCLYMFSIIKKLERVGDHLKNISEELIFYLEAEVLRHNRQKKKKLSKD